MKLFILDTLFNGDRIKLANRREGLSGALKTEYPDRRRR